MSELSAEEFSQLKAAADAGDMHAQHELGWCYRRGDSTKSDIGEAIRYLTLSADQGFAEAQFSLGAFYRKEDLSPTPNYKGESFSFEHPNMEKCRKYTTMAMEQGDGWAEYLYAVTFCDWKTLEGRKETMRLLISAEGHGRDGSVDFLEQLYNEWVKRPPVVKEQGLAGQFDPNSAEANRAFMQEVVDYFQKNHGKSPLWPDEPGPALGALLPAAS